MATRITILRDGATVPPVPGSGVQVSNEEEVLPFNALLGEVKSGRILRRLARYRDSRLRVPRRWLMNRPLLTNLLLRLMSRGTCHVEDNEGVEPITWLGLGRQALATAREYPAARELTRRLGRQVDELLAVTNSQRSGRRGLDPVGRPVYLRAELLFGCASGGQVGHIAGVLNHLQGEFRPPVFLTTDTIPTVSPTVETHTITPRPQFWDYPPLPALAFTSRFTAEAWKILGVRPPAFLYQRNCLFNFSGVQLARVYEIPLVIEYNGSEVWAARHWGKPYPPRFEQLGEKIELLNLRAADLVIVVSQPLRDELMQKGVSEERILVNPNGVDTQRYDARLSGQTARSRYNLENKRVIGFIGTFGLWHGAEVLVEAFGQLLANHPARREDTRLLLIGDGARMPQVRRLLAERGILRESVLTGMVPQAEGPEHLAACDILVAPHVPNPDGSPFFGSPTKLFEYMAMGKGIVASALGQMQEILEHDRTAWLVPPGDVSALSKGLYQLLMEPARRQRLGFHARQCVETRYTWRQHTRRIIHSLYDLVSQRRVA